MTSRYTIKIVEDLISNGVDTREIEHLLDIAAYAIERIAPTLARSAVFNLADFATAKQRGISGFALTLSRQIAAEQEAWVAEFRQANRSVRVLLTLTVPD